MATLWYTGSILTKIWPFLCFFWPFFGHFWSSFTPFKRVHYWSLFWLQIGPKWAETGRKNHPFWPKFFLCVRVANNCQESTNNWRELLQGALFGPKGSYFCLFGNFFLFILDPFKSFLGQIFVTRHLICQKTSFLWNLKNGPIGSFQTRHFIKAWTKQRLRMVSALRI